MVTVVGEGGGGVDNIKKNTPGNSLVSLYPDMAPPFPSVIRNTPITITVVD